MKTIRVIGLLGCMVLLLLSSCAGNRVAAVQGYGGYFETGKPELVVSSGSASGIRKEQIEPVSETKTIPLQLKHATRNKVAARFISRKLGSAKMAAKIKGNPNPPLSATSNPERPMEPNSFWGFWLVIGSMIANVLISALSGAITSAVSAQAFSTLISVAGLFTSIAFISGFILGIVALGIHHRNPDKYRGKGKALFAVIFPAISIILTLLILVLMITLLAMF